MYPERTSSLGKDKEKESGFCVSLQNSVETERAREKKRMEEEEILSKEENGH